MTDRELLKLAAKAAGMTLTWEGDNPPYPRSRRIEQPNLNPPWNPRDDDGDALRLAVRLKLSVDFFDDAITVEHTPDNSQCYEVIEPVGTDPYTATRRAIVRAAAEIGRAMP